ncbi:MAG TPA: 3-carboxy-cis,cis-muconate cycloisomerase [Casimicrobiaceae bacterium]
MSFSRAPARPCSSTTDRGDFVPDSLFTTDAMRAVFADRTRLSRMLDFEAALAQAGAGVGVIPQSAADAIEAHCNVDEFDVTAIGDAAWNAGNLAIPLVAALTRNVAAADAQAKGYVHWGATSQDAIDTGLVLQLRDALALIDADLERLARSLAHQARRHAATVMAGRTWLAQALPITFGLKLAAIVGALDRHRDRVGHARKHDLVLQFGGAAGTLASLHDRGIAVTDALARRLGLDVPDMPWHTERDRFCDVASTLGMLTATLGKLARDLSLLAQTEVAEAFEPSAPGRGGSSTMPQKRNPVGASIALAAAVRVPGLVATMLSAAVQEHERGIGNWPAEWETLPQIVMLTAGALGAMREVVDGLDIDCARMRANLDLTRGQIFAEAVQMALAPKIGRDTAHSLVARACRRAAADHADLRDILLAEPGVSDILDGTAVDRLFDPAGYLGESAAYIERALARYPASAG